VLTGSLENAVEDENKSLKGRLTRIEASRCISRSLDIHYAQVPVLRKVSPTALEVSIEIAGPDLEGLEQIPPAPKSSMYHKSD
jgi:hypothetical protein